MLNTKIMFWNCQGATQKHFELLKFEIVLLNNSPIKYQAIQTSQFSHIHTSLTNLWSTVSFLLGERRLKNILIPRKCIHHYNIKIQINSLTNTVIHINLGNSELQLVFVYKSPSSILQIVDLDKLLNTPQCHNAGDLV